MIVILIDQELLKPDTELGLVNSLLYLISVTSFNTYNFEGWVPLSPCL